MFLILLFTSTADSKEKWMSVQSEHFRMVGNVSEKTLQDVGYKLEQFRSAFSLLFPSLQLDDFQPVKVFVFNSHNSFRPYKPLYEGKPRENIAGYFLTDETAKYIAFTTDGTGIDRYELIFHEYTHFIVEKNFPNAPVWFNEGLAEFYSSFETTNNGKKIRLGLPLSRHVQNLKNRYFLPFEMFLRVDHRSPYFNESNKSNIFYSQAWAFVHYLLIGNNGMRRAQFQLFFDKINAGEFLENAFKDAFQIDYKQMENELKNYVSQPSFFVIESTFNHKPNTATDFRVVTISEPEVEILLADIQAYVGRLEEAANKFQKIIFDNPNFSDGYLFLAKLRLYQERYDEAKLLVEKAVSLNSKNWLAQYYYGNFLRDKGNFEEAITAYRESTKIMPGFSYSQSALAFTLSLTDNLNEAITTYQKLIELEPYNEQNYRNLSNILLRAGRGQLAAEYAKKFLRMKGWRNENSHYAALVVYFALLQTQETKAAEQFLNDALSKLDSTVWAYPVLRYLKGELTAEQVLNKANNQQKQIEAHAYIGMNLSFKGNITDALTHLNWVKENGNKNTAEYGFAISEIKRIETKKVATN
jgi:tetratricopeptide (TPR) repeat protein